jgi:hypothetical protein
MMVSWWMIRTRSTDGMNDEMLELRLYLLLGYSR